MNHLVCSRRALALVCSPTLALGLLFQQAPQPTAAVQPYVYTGTVRAVQAQTGSLDLITGVGHAVRLVHISALPETRMTSGPAAIRLTDLAPGDQLTAECRMTPAGLVADRIEKLPAPGRVP